MNYVWSCPTEKILYPLFAECFSNNHLDIGVATGYFPMTVLKRAGSSGGMNLTLVDLNPNSLAMAKQRVSTQNPTLDINTVIADVTTPAPEALQLQKFKSISMFNLLHCVPGPCDRKTVAFGHYAKLLDKDGIFFGCTVLGYKDEKGNPQKLNRGMLCYLEMKLLNWIGWFDNWKDGKEAMTRALEHEFAEVEAWVEGSMLLWKARQPRH